MSKQDRINKMIYISMRYYALSLDYRLGLGGFYKRQFEYTLKHDTLSEALTSLLELVAYVNGWKHFTQE